MNLRRSPILQRPVQFNSKPPALLVHRMRPRIQSFCVIHASVYAAQDLMPVGMALLGHAEEEPTLFNPSPSSPGLQAFHTKLRRSASPQRGSTIQSRLFILHPRMLARIYAPLVQSFKTGIARSRLCSARFARKGRPIETLRPALRVI